MGAVKNHFHDELEARRAAEDGELADDHAGVELERGVAELTGLLAAVTLLIALMLWSVGQ
jgi:hypothetical protein